MKQPRLNYYALAPQVFEKFVELEKILADSSVPAALRHLIKLRASQINGCNFCIDMHSKEAKIDGERELRLYHLSSWHESPLFNQKERLALEWTEVITNIATHKVSDELFGKMKENFSDKEIVDMTAMIGLINSWNRFAITFGSIAGSLDKAYGLDKAGLSV